MYSREIINEVKAAVVKEAASMRKLNKELPVSGERFDICLPDRKINIVYYEAKSSQAPLILGFHGGGYLFGGNAMNDRMWTTIRDYLDVNIASIEYRKSPDHKWKEALEDAFDAAVFFAENADKYDFDPNEIWTMGASAGAGLAASMCIMAKKRRGVSLKKQILMYPYLDLDTDPDRKGEGSLSGPIMYVFKELHCTPEEAKLPLVSPVFASLEELEGLPDAIICTADFDNLKYEAFRYAEMLKSADVSVAAKQINGMTHGFIEYIGGENFPGESDYFDDKTRELIANGKLEKGAFQALAFIKENLA